jgi:hypothetical protein
VSWFQRCVRLVILSVDDLVDLAFILAGFPDSAWAPIP